MLDWFSIFRLVLWAASFCISVSAQDHHPDAPSPENFMRRTHARAAVLGSYLYIDGGEINKEGIEDDWNINPPGQAVNSTLSIDLRRPWWPDDLIMNVIPKDNAVPRMQSGGIFDNQDISGSFYIYGGIQSYNTSPPSTGIFWRFRADGNGGGDWIQEVPENNEEFMELTRTTMGSWASTPDAGFWIGGISTERTGPGEYHGPVPGIMSYNWSTSLWFNDSSVDISPGGTLYGASATYMPTFGQNGLIVLLGGSQRYVEGGGDEGDHRPMNEITFFDPVTKDVFTQETSGASWPSKRRYHCAVGVESTIGTFEIFLYGGRTLTGEGMNVDEIWVLSLPGFFWTQVHYEGSYPRNGHTCVLAGNRQLVSIGGFNNNGLNESEWWRVKDNFPQGIGIFDMTALQWKDSFDPNAGDYESSPYIEAWYHDNNLNDTVWSSDTVKAFFWSPDTDDREDNTRSAVSTTGAIVGGAVGATAGIIAILTLSYFIWRSRRIKRATVPELEHTPIHQAPDPAEPKPGASPTSPSTLDNSPAEAHGSPDEIRHEMSGRRTSADLR